MPPAPRLAGKDDAAAFAELHGSCFDPPWEEGVMALFLADPSCLCLCDGEAGAPCRALLMIRIAADEAEILTLATDAAARRQGLARSLLQEAREKLARRGIRHLFLEVDESNRAAIALYESLGAAPVGRRAAYYADGADAAIYRLAL